MELTLEWLAFVTEVLCHCCGGICKACIVYDTSCDICHHLLVVSSRETAAMLEHQRCMFVNANIYEWLHH